MDRYTKDKIFEMFLTFVKAVFVFIVVLVLTNAALAFDEGQVREVPISTNIVQCGSKDEIEKSCSKDERCCIFLKNRMALDYFDKSYDKEMDVEYENNNSTPTATYHME